MAVLRISGDGGGVLGGASGDISAGKGLGLGTDAKEGRDDWKLPRDK